MRLCVRLGAVSCGGLALLAPSLALAGNMTHPRTPVVWNDVECATLVDRSVTPVWHLEYDIPYEDLEVGADEVADSRTHQFFALCRDNSPQDYLPGWISGADIEDAASIDLVDPATVDPAQVFETSTAWQDCWFRINGDDERLPISNASAAAGVDWDLAGLPAGGYVIQGYTYEPPINVWVQRPGFVKIHDGDPDAAPPAIAITTGEIVLEADGVEAFEGCVDAMDGSTITAYWAPAESGEVTWTAFLEDEPVSGSQFSIDLAAPAELVGDTGMLRVDVEDPMGRTFTGYGLETVIVLAPMAGDDGCEGGGFVQGPDCNGSGDDTAGGSEGSGTAATGPLATGSGDDDGATSTPIAEGDGGGGGSCACTTTPSRVPGAMLVLFALFGIRRRAGLRE
jgi:MYXO-CTERM domain-containing protein